MNEQEFEAELRRVTAAGYYDKHEFHQLLHSGKLNKGQLQAWALNRYCFQASAPRKDAIIISRSVSRDFRREWTLRILDHDGFGQDDGGIERWLKLTDGLGLNRQFVTEMSGVLPETKEAIEGYLEYVRNEPFVGAVATTLTELLAPDLHRTRMSSMLESYSFLNAETLSYFKKRLTHAPRDASFALDFVKENATTARAQQLCIGAVEYKCKMLTKLLDALYAAYVAGNLPPGAFVPDGEALREIL